ncbi:MAG TPA: DNA ligase D, partial [Planctomycetaceae bacterium]|nr:DNA ligase D [Planctomycetaceae bacterium]
SRKTGKLVYYAFDLLYLDGYDLRGVRLEERKRVLAAILPKEARGRLQVSDHVEGSGAQFFEQCPQLGLEGIVSKRRDRPWQAGRGEGWLKSKCVQREEFVIGGYTDSAASRHDLGALVVGYYVTGKGLAYAGKVGTGFTAKTHRDLRERLKAREQDASPFSGPTEPGETVHWVRPELVAEVEYRNWTRDGLLWHPSFLGLREDRAAATVVRDDAPLPVQSANQRESREPARKPAAEQPPKPRRPRPLTKSEVKSLQKVELTHPGRILYPAEGITKRDLVGYYAAVADWMLPHVFNRPVSFVRCPRGQGGPQFFQKHVAGGTPETLRRVVIRENEKDETYLVIDDLPGLVSVVQMSVLEIHPWGATSDDIEHPDRMIFDLDPDPAVGWPTVIEAAGEIHELLDDAGLESFVKTSGGKGLHIVVPLQRRHGWDELKRFARAFCHQLANKSPQRYTASMSKAARPGKIYLDYVRNSRGATAVAPYSTRATERADLKGVMPAKSVPDTRRRGRCHCASAGAGMRFDGCEPASSPTAWLVVHRAWARKRKLTSAACTPSPSSFVVPPIASRIMATSKPCSSRSRKWASTHRLPAGPAMITFSIRRLRSCSTMSLVDEPYTLCGLRTTVRPSQT